MSNTNNIFTPPTTLVNLEEDQPEKDFNETVEKRVYSRKFRFCKGFETSAAAATTTTTTNDNKHLAFIE